MSNLKSYDSIIFDLDGTLWDATEATARGWQKLIQEQNLNLSVNALTVKSVAGLPVDECIARVFGVAANQNPDLKAKIHQAEQDEVIKYGGQLYDGVAEGFLKLKEHFQLFIVSNCDRWYLDAFLSHSKFSQHIDGSLCFGETGRPKGENIQKIVNDHKLIRPLYVGDTVWDQEAAKKANVDFEFVSYGFGKVAIQNSFQSDSFMELTSKLLKEMKGKNDV